MRKKKGDDDWRRLERHRLSAGYPDLTGQAWEDFKANLREHGLNGRKIVLYEGKVLDGWQLQRACLESDVEPEYRKLPKGRDPQQFVWEANEFRRHESEQAMERRVAARRQYAAELEANGESLRDIAAKTGTSKTQAKRDLEEHKRMSNSGVPQGTPKDDISESVNGTGEPSQGEDKTVVCQRCRRVNKGRPIPGCGSCEAMRRADAQGRKSKKKKAPAPAEADAEEKLDAFKNPVPLKLHDALFDPWIQGGIDTLAKISEQFRTARLGERMQKKAKRYPFFDPKDFADGCGFVMNYLDKLIDHLKDNRPAGVCPECKGLGCGPCRMSGLVPRSLYAELAK